MSGAGTIDQAQVDYFDRACWAPLGAARWLYRYNAVRVPYICDATCRVFGRDPSRPTPLRGLRILDIGCGPGILCEPLAQLGASVVGVDPAGNVVALARARAWEAGLPIDYRCTTAETLAETEERFTVVLAMEVVEHVADFRLFLQTCAQLVGPGGLLVLSTINRTAKSWLQAIVVAEYVLRLLPRRTHEWGRFVRPDEIRAELGQHRTLVTNVSGVTLNIRARKMQLCGKTGVNYLVAAQKKA